MKKKGFTLIELLAVLVILAIIALITIPIVLKTISNSEAKSEMQSIIGYARVIEDNIQNDMMTNPGRNYSYYKEKLESKNAEFFAQLKYKGNKVTCSSYSMDENGELELTCCKVVGGTGIGYNYEKGKVEKNSDISCNAKENNQPSSKKAVDTLLEKTNDVNVTTYESESDASHQMYTFEHPATEQTDALTDYRYIGSDPYNYVEFNDEVWRIIGIFTVEDENGNKENRLKIIRDESIGNMKWNLRNQANYYSANEWKDSILNQYLNGEFYSKLCSSAIKMISPTKIYLGQKPYTNSMSYGTSEQIYAWERGTDRLTINGAPDIPDTSRSLFDITNISLMYPSDYVYTYANGINDNCYKNVRFCHLEKPDSGWLNNVDWQWTVSSSVSYDFAYFIKEGMGENTVAAGYGVRPVTYLKSSVKIVSGTGTSSDPYKLKI